MSLIAWEKSLRVMIKVSFNHTTILKIISFMVGIYDIPYDIYIDNTSLPRLANMNKYMKQKIQNLPIFVDNNAKIDSYNMPFISGIV